MPRTVRLVPAVHFSTEKAANSVGLTPAFSANFESGSAPSFFAIADSGTELRREALYRAPPPLQLRAGHSWKSEMSVRISFFPVFVGVQRLASGFGRAACATPDNWQYRLQNPLFFVPLGGQRHAL
jgi:hypothetical protein